MSYLVRIRHLELPVVSGPRYAASRRLVREQLEQELPQLNGPALARDVRLLRQ